MATSTWLVQPNSYRSERGLFATYCISCLWHGSVNNARRSTPVLHLPALCRTPRPYGAAVANATTFAHQEVTAGVAAS